MATRATTSKPHLRFGCNRIARQEKIACLHVGLKPSPEHQQCNNAGAKPSLLPMYGGSDAALRLMSIRLRIPPSLVALGLGRNSHYSYTIRSYDRLLLPAFLTWMGIRCLRPFWPVG